MRGFRGTSWGSRRKGRRLRGKGDGKEPGGEGRKGMVAPECQKHKHPKIKWLAKLTMI